ncbi:MAG: hypothetical protein ACRDSN_06320, partial [Pseudonocardiaceae bacterium]
PMDQINTVQIPRTLVNAADPLADPDATMVIPLPAGDPSAGARGGFGPARPRHQRLLHESSYQE